MAVTAAGTGTLTPSLTSRTVADMVTNTTTTITSATAAFVSGDVGRIVTGSADLPWNAYIASVSNGTTALLNIAATGSHSAQTLNLTTEYVMLDINAAATYTSHINKINMAAGDMVELRIYQTILTGDTGAVVYKFSYFDAQPTDDMITIGGPISNELTDTTSLRFTLKQTLGTARAFKWKVLKYA